MVSNKDNDAMKIMDADFDSAVGDIRAEVVESHRNIFEHVWELKSLLIGLSAAGY